MNKKAVLSLLMAVMMLLTLTACLGDKATTDSSPAVEGPTAQESPETTDPAAGGEDEADPEPDEKDKTEEAAKKENESAAKPQKAIAATSISAAALTVEVGKSAQLSVAFTPADTTDKTLSFTSSDASIATVSADGAVTGHKTGTATITITAASGVQTTAKVTVKTAKTVAVTALSSSALTVEVGKTAALSVTVTPADATDKTLGFATSDASIATVSAGGTVTGHKAGTATITITAASGVQTTATVTVTAAKVPANSMEVFPNAITQYVNESFSLRVTLSPSGATTTVFYASDNPAVATVDGAGHVTGVATGSANITVSTDNGMTISIPVTIQAKESTAGATGSFDYDWCQQVFALVNQERAAAGLAALTYQSGRQDLADARAVEIVSDFSHNGARNCNGENIAFGQTSPEEVMTAWMNSPGHRANILTAEFTAMVVSCYYVDGVYYWVQLFFV